MPKPYHAPARASFTQKLGPGGGISLLLAVATALGGLLVPVLWRLSQVLRGAGGDSPVPADGVLVLGRQLEGDQPTAVFLGRLVHGHRLWAAGLAPRLFVAGGTTGTATRSEAEAGRDWLMARGVPQESILLEDRSQHTLENLFNVREAMRASGWQTLLVVSDPLHLARTKATAGGLSLQVCCSPAPEAPPLPGSLAWWRRAALEAFLLHWYHVGMAYSRLTGSREQLDRVT